MPDVDTVAHNRLVSHGNHLLIVRQTSVWPSTITMVIPPTAEKYCAVAVWGTDSRYNVDMNAEYSGEELMGYTREKLASLTADDWVDGHKCIFHYTTRKGSPGAFSQGVAKNDNLLETGISRHALRFDLRAYPFGMHPDSKVYLRIHHPSAVKRVLEAFVIGYDAVRTVGFGGAGQDQTKNGGLLEVAFSPELEVPGFEGQGFVDVPSNANTGATDGSSVVTPLSYDVWNVSAKASFDKIFQCMQAYPHPTSSYVDIELTGTAFDALKQCTSESRYVWLMLGFRAGNLMAAPNATSATDQRELKIGYAMSLRVSRVELVITASGNTYN